jgi:1-deoxyxylulose-5-phosphate synthase
MLRLEPVVSVQKEYNLLNREIETELVPLCAAHGLGILPYRPLASGFLTGKYRPGEPPPAGTRLALNRRNQEQLLTQRNFVVLSRLEKFVAERGHSMSELAIAWLLANPLVSSVIAGASSPNQVAENVKASCWHLTPEDMAELDKLITADK